MDSSLFDPSTHPNDPNGQHQPQQMGAVNWNQLTQVNQPPKQGVISQGQAPRLQDSGAESSQVDLSGLSNLLHKVISGGNTNLSSNSTGNQPSEGTGQNTLSQIFNPSSKSSSGSNNLYDYASQYTGMNSDSSALRSALQKSNPGLDPSQTPWCAGFVGSVLKANGIDGTGSLAAKSYLNFGTPTQNPQKGDLVVYNDLTGNNNPDHGHIGFVDHIDQTTGKVYTLGGNQSGGVNIKAYPISAVAGFRQIPTGQQIQQYSQSKGINDPNLLPQMPQKIHDQMTYQQSAPQNASPELPHVMNAIAQNETGGTKNPYQSVTSAGKGAQALGKYQILNTNVPAWTNEALGHPMTQKQFLNNPQAQEKTAAFKLNEYVQKYGPSGASRAWFGGEGAVNGKDNAKDNLGTTVKGYEQQFNKNYLKSKNGMSLNEPTEEGGENPPLIPHEQYEDVVHKLDAGKDDYASNERYEGENEDQMNNDSDKQYENFNQPTTMPIINRPNNDKTISPTKLDNSWLDQNTNSGFKGAIQQQASARPSQDQIDWQALINSKMST